MVCLHWTTPRPRLIPLPLEWSLMIMLGSVYTELQQISIGSVNILSVSVLVSVSGSVNKP